MNMEFERNEMLEFNRQIILQGICGTITPEQVESSTMFAMYLSHVGIRNKNYSLFLKLLETNNPWIVDALIGDRKPELLFSTLKIDSYLIRKAFDLLTSWHPGQIYYKVLLAVLGIIQYAYYNPDDGYRIYPFELSEINNLGKFLQEEETQFIEINEVILEILDKVRTLGVYENNKDKSILAKHSYNIRIAFFDNSKSLLDIIPKVLMVRLKREDTEVRPSKEFVSFIGKKYNNLSNK